MGIREREKKRERMCVAAFVPGRGPGRASGVQGPRRQVAYLGMAIANTYEKLHC